MAPFDQTWPFVQSIYAAMNHWNALYTANTTVASFDTSTNPPAVTTSPAVGTGTSATHTISFWGNFAGTGLTGAIAATIVRINVMASPGMIKDADTVLDMAETDTNNKFLWKFVEHNNLGAETLVSGTNTTAPVIGYVDLEGVLTHEMGHFLGLSHSLIDAVQNDSSGYPENVPVMFSPAQLQVLGSTTVKYMQQVGTVCCFRNSYPASGVILGTSARVLQHDDKMAISRQYPGSSFSYNTITGFVKNGATPIPGVVVVAVETSSPSATRVQTLTYDSGDFTLSGLPDGTYYIYAESFDQDPSGGGSTDYYFTNNDAPSYLSEPTGGCIPSPAPTPIQTEFYNTSEQANESPCLATSVTVSGGSTTPIGTISATTATNILRVQETPTGGMTFIASPRGAQFGIPGSGSKTVNLVINAGATYAGYRYDIEFAPTRNFTMMANGELDQVSQSTATGVPSMISNGTLDSSGSDSQAIAITSSALYEVLFAQVKIKVTTTSAPSLRSNCVTLWATN